MRPHGFYRVQKKAYDERNAVAGGGEWIVAWYGFHPMTSEDRESTEGWYEVADEIPTRSDKAYFKIGDMVEFPCE